MPGEEIISAQLTCERSLKKRIMVRTSLFENPTKHIESVFDEIKVAQ